MIETIISHFLFNPHRICMRTYIVIFLIIAAALVIIWAFVIEPNFILLRDDVSIVSEKWPKSLDGLKVVVAADFHAGKYFGEKERIKRAVDAIKAEKPDVVFLLGDYINQAMRPNTPPRNVMNLDELAAILSEIRPPYGMYAIFGNHDLNYNAAKEVGAMLEKAGAVVLRNNARIISTPRGNFAVYGAIDTPQTSGRANRAMSKIPEDIPIIALSHSPDGATVLSGRPVIILAGHTHGGQIRFPYCRPIFSNCKLGRNYADGLSEMGGSYLYTTRGLGTSRIPARFACPPTISTIKFYSPGANARPTPARPPIGEM